MGTTECDVNHDIIVAGFQCRKCGWQRPVIPRDKPGLNLCPLSESERDQWVVMTANALPALFTTKFKAGQIEHKGDIGSVPLMSLLQEMEQESLDQLAYVREIKRRVMLVSGR